MTNEELQAIESALLPGKYTVAPAVNGSTRTKDDFGILRDGSVLIGEFWSECPVGGKGLDDMSTENAQRNASAVALALNMLPVLLAEARRLNAIIQQAIDMPHNYNCNENWAHHCNCGLAEEMTHVLRGDK